MKTIYPGGFKDKSKYSRALIWKYSELYPELSTEQLQAPITRVINNITSLINQFEYYNIILSRIEIIKKFLKSGYNNNEISRTSGEGIILSYSIGDEQLLRRLMKEDFPEEHREKYIKFVSEMTKNTIRELCTAIEQEIPYSAKIEYQRWLEEARSAADNAAVVSEKLIETHEKENISPKKRTFVEMVRRDDSSLSETNKKRVKKKNHLKEVEEEDDNLDEYSEASSVSQKSDESSYILMNDKISKNQHTIEQDDLGIKCDISYQEQSFDENHDDMLLNPQLARLYAWLSNLPEYLQKQMLTSEPVRALIETAKQDAAIYDSQYTYNQLSSLFTISKAHNLANEIADHPDEKVIIANYTSEELVDTSLILDSPQVTRLILPVESVGSTEILPEPIFHGFEVL